MCSSDLDRNGRSSGSMFSNLRDTQRGFHTALLALALMIPLGTVSVSHAAANESGETSPEWQRTQNLVTRFLAADDLSTEELRQLRGDVRELLEPLSRSGKGTGAGGGDSPTQTFGFGIATGATLLLGGWLLGSWLRRYESNYDRQGLSNPQVTSLLTGLSHWTTSVANEISHFRNVVDGVSRDVTAAGTPDGPNVKMGDYVGRIMTANRDLQQRLDAAEATLQSQSDSLVAFLSEARTDPLTRLPNRRTFDEELNRREAEWRRYGHTFSVMVVDVDHFKKFNDHFGHLVGDVVLSAVAKKLKESGRSTDLVARLGGEEFAVVLPRMGSNDAIQASERIRRAIGEMEIPHEGRSLHVTVSCGAAQILAGESTTTLVQRADDALYASKKSGRNAAHWHDGRRCLRIAGNTLIPPEPDTTSGSGARGHAELEKLDVPPQLAEVCRALRNRFEAIGNSDSP